MTALETQLTEIVEKEQGQKIIPFLQKLTQEERKSLIPCTQPDSPFFFEGRLQNNACHKKAAASGAPCPDSSC